MPRAVREIPPFWLLVLLALALRGSAAPAQTTTTRSTSAPTTAPTTAPEPMVANPHYLAWSEFEPGAQSMLQMNLNIGGQQVTTNVTMTLKSLTAEKAVVESVARMSLPGLPDAQDQTQLQAFAAKVPASQAARADLPPGTTGKSEDIGTETIEVNGQLYETRVREFTGTIQEQPVKGKIWRSERVPGGVVKMEYTSPNTKLRMMLEQMRQD